MRIIKSILFVVSLQMSLPSFSQTFQYDFENGTQGWQPDFADYYVADSLNWHLQWVHDTMPSILPVQKGISISGDNLSDDLFMFMKRQITGLLPNTTYRVQFNIDMVTNDPPDGIGGCSCVLKAGVTRIEPVKLNDNGYYILNIDKGNQSAPGNDMDTIGNLVHAYPGDFSYHLASFNNAGRYFEITTDASGSLWLITGAESAFEVPVAVHFAQVSFSFTQYSGFPSDKEIADPVHIYHNPAADQLFIKAQHGILIREINILDIQGRLIYRSKPSLNSAIDISVIQTGIYIISVSTDHGMFQRKLVK